MDITPRIVNSDPEILGGTPVFIGTRVPIKTLIDYLEAGDSLDEFLDHFPSVRREQAIAALELAKEMLTAYGSPALGWSGKKNGELMQLMVQEGFTILLTTDQNLRYQQNLQQSGVAVVVLVAPSNRLPDLVPLIPNVRNVVGLVEQ